jgi:hypothetical protein
MKPLSVPAWGAAGHVLPEAVHDVTGMLCATYA